MSKSECPCSACEGCRKRRREAAALLDLADLIDQLARAIVQVRYGFPPTAWRPEDLDRGRRVP